jgi:hypothetical protein
VLWKERRREEKRTEKREGKRKRKGKVTESQASQPLDPDDEARPGEGGP